MAEQKVNGYAGASAVTLAPATNAVSQPPNDDTSNATKLLALKMKLSGSPSDIARFMPVMDIEQALARREVFVQATARLMTDGVDFGKIPGTDRDTLLQPGADKLCNLFGIVIEYEEMEKEEDWTGERHGGEPFFYYKVKGKAYRGDFLMGQGVGSCSSWESKYRWRKAERVCPLCSKENIRKSRQDDGWYCWAKTGGCGATFRKGDPAIESQETGRKPNADVFDAVNTVLKIAYKRCKVATTINATSASEFFTQDVEDFEQPDLDTRGINTGGHPVGTKAAADFVAEQKIAELKKQQKPQPAAAPVADPEPDLSKMSQVKAVFGSLRERLGETRYFEELQLAGVADPSQFRTVLQARECWRRLLKIAELQKKEVA